jgi:hypothetical protein
MTARPVTQTADAAVKRASTKLRRLPLDAKGIRSRKAPIRISRAKLRIKILDGVRRRKVDLLIRCSMSTPTCPL